MGKALLACLLAAAGVFAYSHRDWARAERLRRTGMLTTGRVTGKSDAKRRQIYYAFDTPRKMFTDVGTGGYGNPDYDHLEEGDPVIVYYLPEDPDVSCLGDPGDRVRDQHNTLMWVLLPGFALGGWALSRELRRHAA